VPAINGGTVGQCVSAVGLPSRSRYLSRLIFCPVAVMQILFKAGVHPEAPANTLDRAAFDRVWRHSVLLLQRGFKTGSILTVDPEEAQQLGGRGTAMLCLCLCCLWPAHPAPAPTSSASGASGMCCCQPSAACPTAVRV
jgi:hypothetical protein